MNQNHLTGSFLLSLGLLLSSCSNTIPLTNYYDNNDPNEYSIKVTTLSTVKAVPLKYVYHFKQKEFRNYSFPIYIQASSDKTQKQIFTLQGKARKSESVLRLS